MHFLDIHDIVVTIMLQNEIPSLSFIAASKISVCKISPPASKIETLGSFKASAKFSLLPLKKLSYMVTLLTSSARSLSTVCEPIKPAPPITRSSSH